MKLKPIGRQKGIGGVSLIPFYRPFGEGEFLYRQNSSGPFSLLHVFPPSWHHHRNTSHHQRFRLILRVKLRQNIPQFTGLSG